MQQPEIDDDFRSGADGVGAYERSTAYQNYGRAIATIKQRRILAGVADTEVDTHARNVAITRVRKRIEEELPRDLYTFVQHEPRIADELLQVVQSHLDVDSSTTRFTDMETLTVARALERELETVPPESSAHSTAQSALEKVTVSTDQ